MCLFRYETDVLSASLGQPVDGPPHTVLMGPAGEEDEEGDGWGAAAMDPPVTRATRRPNSAGPDSALRTALRASDGLPVRSANAGDLASRPATAAVARAAAAKGAALRSAAVAPIMLNQGAGVRPAHDPRGWKWKEDVTRKRDASLLHAPRAVARIDYQMGGWTAGVGGEQDT